MYDNTARIFQAYQTAIEVAPLRGFVQKGHRQSSHFGHPRLAMFGIGIMKCMSSSLQMDRALLCDVFSSANDPPFKCSTIDVKLKMTSRRPLSKSQCEQPSSCKNTYVEFFSITRGPHLTSNPLKLHCDNDEIVPRIVRNSLPCFEGGFHHGSYQQPRSTSSPYCCYL
jgi:hypothetical protein